MPKITDVAKNNPKSSATVAFLGLLTSIVGIFHNDLSNMRIPGVSAAEVASKLHGDWIREEPGASPDITVERQLSFYTKDDSGKSNIRLHIKLKGKDGKSACDLHYKVKLTIGDRPDEWKYSARFNKEKYGDCASSYQQMDEGTIEATDGLTIAVTSQTGVVGKEPYKKE